MEQRLLLWQYQKLILVPLSLCCCCCICLTSATFNPNTCYFLDCGSLSSDVAGVSDNRTFIPDSNSSSSPSPVSSSVSITSPHKSTSSLLLSQTARVFIDKSSYRFKLNSTGAHIVRLHFYPFSTANYNLTSATFNVSALGSLLLLANFTATAPIVKEHCLWVDSDELLVTFTPSGSSPRLAFINAIEVFTAPSNLINDSAFRYIDSFGLDGVSGVSRHALEMVYRINVGGPLIRPSNDSLWRTWVSDADYLYRKEVAVEVNSSRPIQYQITGLTREIAPDSVYSTARAMNVQPLSQPWFNITWEFNVNSGVKYLVRMHFCDFMSSSPDQLYFNVYINSKSAYSGLRPWGQSTHNMTDVPFYLDFVIDQEQSELMHVSVGRSELISDSQANAILNGLEIMKMKNSFGRLNVRAFNPSDLLSNITILKRIIFYVLGGLGLLVLLVSVSFLVQKQWRKPTEAEQTSMSWSPMTTDGERRNSMLTFNLGLHITFDEIVFATNGFDEKLIVGTGGFGRVYKGKLRDGTKVAVKQNKPGSMQGYPEFQTEVMVLSQIRHRHLVSLIGYCDENSQMILVYEFMEKGSLKNYLYGTANLPCLSWKQRLEICIGAARGIHYLHTGYSPGIVHRDVKSSNILLGEDYFARVSDFGLSRCGPPLGESYVSTSVKGTFGYLDPEYYMTQQLTDKSDVYSFGMVLFEVLCARPVIDACSSTEQLNLAEWAIMHCRETGLLEQILDPRLKGNVNQNSLRKFAETAEKCVAERGVDRPSIGDVLWNLEYALQLQETELRREPYEDSGSHESQIPVVAISQTPSSHIPIGEDHSARDTRSDETDSSASKVFSHLNYNEGR